MLLLESPLVKGLYARSLALTLVEVFEQERPAPAAFVELLGGGQCAGVPSVRA